jgi:hypothetical protein
MALSNAELPAFSHFNNAPLPGCLPAPPSVGNGAGRQGKGRGQGGDSI